MAATPALTSREVARALGVSESSVKRWCDGGRVRTVRTPGGHRRIPVEAVLELARSGGLAVEDPTRLAATEAAAPTSPGAARRDLVRALVRDDAAGVRGILASQRLATSGLDIVADEVVAPAMARIGEQWSRGVVQVYEERRACGLLEGSLHAMRDRLEPTARGAPVAIGGTLEGDPYSLPTLIAEIVLRERGFAARSLGAWLPADTLARAIEDERPRLVWVSVGHVGERFRADYALVERAARAVGAAVVIGGRGLGAEQRKGLRYASFCDGMVQLASFAAALRGTNDVAVSPPDRSAGRRGRAPP